MSYFQLTGQIEAQSLKPRFLETFDGKQISGHCSRVVLVMNSRPALSSSVSSPDSIEDSQFRGDGPCVIFVEAREWFGSSVVLLI
ncbi:hypothetical protein TNCV_3030151 [Trichonephila clavipes]|nr:hypothetical protein TNCV_3030151 [Trichonephila clavipes]